jgi:nucleotide-binding universal stress UspA family protein
MLNTVLVALNAEPQAQGFSQKMVTALQDLNLGETCQVILSHVVPTDSEHLDVLADRPSVEADRSPHRWLEDQLKTYGRKIPCKTEVEVVVGDPAEEILRLAHIYHTDLIVMGSRGLTGMEKILKRSVSAQVSEEAPCSVLVVKQS